MNPRVCLFLGLLLTGSPVDASENRASGPEEASHAHNQRMAWWREARFGMFIHWGLYAIPAGEWNGQSQHGEWIRHSARIPIEEYEKFVGRFNPVKFSADEWVRIARDAGMKYIVITSKHHDGFCLWDSQQTDYDVMSTPFRRDILKELSEACRREGIRLCFYHSIMDWHHPDYLPRRPWEEAQRPTAGADFDRYVQYMKAQLRELVTNYGPLGVLWFDGEWEDNWNHERGVDLYHFVRGLQPDIIINNRVDKGRSGMAGLTVGDHMGDYGTPEQVIPATGVPGVDWETCMTMNDHWGFNKADKNFKSAGELLRMLCDIASKGGNFLLNVGPTAEGEIPPETVERLRDIGEWMKANGAAIYGTQASPLGLLPWGRCTRAAHPEAPGRGVLFFHVFDWPSDGRLVVHGLVNNPQRVFLGTTPDSGAGLVWKREQDALVIEVPPTAPDPHVSVISATFADELQVVAAPQFDAASTFFIDSVEIILRDGASSFETRYTTDGTPPTPTSPRVEGPIRLTDTTAVTARVFRGAQPVSAASAATFTKVAPRPAAEIDELQSGLLCEYFEGDYDKLPDFSTLTPAKVAAVTNLTLQPRERGDAFGMRFSGYLNVPRDGVYTFWLASDDGSRLTIGDTLVVDNDGLHADLEKSGQIALARGAHPIVLTFFEKSGEESLRLRYAGPGINRAAVPDEAWCRVKRAELRPPGGARGVEPPATKDAPADLPKPTPQQLAWHAVEFAAFVHFGINTFTDREWGDGTESPALFNPTEFDARQWVRVFEDAGMQQVILTAKHHDGFCLWPSAYTEHSVKNSPWRGGNGDVVREVADACREAGLRFGVYLSPWDRHEPSYGDSPRYNEHYRRQLTELLTNYGPVCEVWWDGACGEGPNGKRQVYDWPSFTDVVRKLAPQAVIFSDAGPDVRWVGTERGFAGTTNWCTLRRDEFFPGTPEFKRLTEGHADGRHWVPAECDVSIRPGWFYHPAEDAKVKSLGELLDIWYGSVGRGAVLLLNVPADRRGLIHENDAARLREMRSALDETFAVNLAAGLAVRDESASAFASPHPAAHLLDGDRHTFWMPAGSAGPWAAEISFENPRSIDRIVLRERIEDGQRVCSFAIEADDGSGPRTVAEGTTIGYQRVLRIDPVTLRRLRLVVRDARAIPAIAELGLFKSAPRESAALDRVAPT